MAYLPASLLPPAHDKIEGQRYRTTQNAFTPAISPHRAFNLTQQLVLCAQTLAKETGQPLPCLAYPNSCRSYLVYSRPARCTARPTSGQSNHSKTHRSQPSRFRRDCTELHYYVPPSRFTNLLSRFHWPSRFGRDVLYSGVKCLAITLYRAFVALSCPLFLCTLSYVRTDLGVKSCRSHLQPE